MGAFGTVQTQEGGRVTVGGRVLHPSHSLRHKRRVVYCSACGCMATAIPRQLLHRCLRAEAGAYGAAVLSRIARGLTPRAGTDWPEPEGFKVPERWRQLVPESEHSAASAAITDEVSTPAQAKMAAVHARLRRKFAQEPGGCQQ